MCDCVDVDFGTYSNTVMLGFYPAMRKYRLKKLKAGLSDYGIDVDRCIAEQVIFLWENGISTYGSCCGHNKAQGMINVGDDGYDDAIKLGFEPYVFSDKNGGSTRRDTVKTK